MNSERNASQRRQHDTRNNTIELTTGIGATHSDPLLSLTLYRGVVVVVVVVVPVALLPV